MHELSVAQNIVEIIRQHIPESELERVIAVRLKVGTAVELSLTRWNFHSKSSQRNHYLVMLGWKLNQFHFVFIVILAIQQRKTKLDLHCAIIVEAQTQKLYLDQSYT